MRVWLAGPSREREWIRRVLADAGIEVAEESAAAPAPPNPPNDVDVVVEVLPEPLTARERDVLALLAEGLPNKRIADALAISDQTVKFHVASIMGKLGTANRVETVRLAVRRGLISL